MGNKQQTALCYLIFELKKSPMGRSMFHFMVDEFNQALQMEREQKINDYNEGVDSEYEYHINSAPRITAEQYYNQTYAD